MKNINLDLAAILVCRLYGMAVGEVQKQSAYFASHRDNRTRL